MMANEARLKRPAPHFMKPRLPSALKISIFRALSALLAGGALFLTSCMTPYPGPAEVQGGVTGAVVGGLAGAVIGHQSGCPLEGAAIGGALGALAGSAIGASEDARYGYHPRYAPVRPQRFHVAPPVILAPAPIFGGVGYSRWGGRGF